MVVVTQLIYVHEGREADFLAFEDAVLPLLREYDGELLLRIRPDAPSMIGGSAERPYEVHVVRFESEDALARYTSSEARQRVLHLKESSVRAAVVIKGIAGP
jgi:antibiotic biosynthesis monooxygenase (ABM) superfamily enzyme